MSQGTQTRQVRYLNNIIEQDHRFIKKRVRAMLGFNSYETATSILKFREVLHMMKKRRLHQQVKSAQNEIKFIRKLF